MVQLPKSPHKFLIWWAVDTPKRIFTVFKRIMILVNNELSFTLNARLLFTPLFGDYTVIGRIIGLFIRIMEIISGLVIMVMLTALTLILPISWWTLPFYALYEIHVFLIPIIAIAYFIWTYQTLNIPDKKLHQVENYKDWKKCVRPDTGTAYTLIKSNFKFGLNKLTKKSPVVLLLQRCELNTMGFLTDLAKLSELNSEDVEKKMFEYAKAHEARYIEFEHLFTAILSTSPNIENLLASHDSKIEILEKSSEWNVKEREKLAKIYIWQDDYEVLYTGGIGKGMTGVVTPFLDSVSTDYTKEVQKGRLKNIVGREEEIRQIAEMLTGSKDNILIIGEAGSGKTSIIQGIAHRIIRGTKYKSLKNRRLVSLEIGGIIAGTATAGQIAEKLNNVINEIKRSRDIILFLDEIHNVVAGTGDQQAETSAIFTILEPLIASEQVQVIGATTIRNYRKFIEPNGAFTRLFQVIEISESSFDDTIEILKEKARELESRHGVFITYPALTETVKLSEKLIHERVLPDKAIDIISRAATRVANDNKYLNKDEISKEVADMTKIPVESVTKDEAKKLLTINKEMKNMVIGQDHALKQISSALKRARVGIRNEDKPIASFLFIGTTGVGKTQTAKALAKTYFGDEKTMIRLDMSEYQQLDSLNRLIGAPDGSIRGILTDKVRSRPFALILLDEIEKAHPNILLTFLQILDEGHVTDSMGTVIDFSNTIIIATSNVGTRAIQEVFRDNGDYEKMKDTAMTEVRNHFAPEFLNRFSGIIVFHPLTKENVRDIALLLLSKVKEIAEEKGVKVTFQEVLIEELMKRGYNPEWGARPLARVIEDSVESYLATKFLTEEIKKGDILDLGTEVFEDDKD
ncbi:ATP-dependent Clp protease ATP-binding subunit [Patescibacteria group bacterium]|nr:ATP-dependent Clp protease ATP-binding subunit [Patescibacteria group bacterium]